MNQKLSTSGRINKNGTPRTARQDRNVVSARAFRARRKVELNKGDSAKNILNNFSKTYHAVITTGMQPDLTLQNIHQDSAQQGHCETCSQTTKVMENQGINRFSIALSGYVPEIESSSVATNAVATKEKSTEQTPLPASAETAITNILNKQRYGQTSQQSVTPAMPTDLSASAYQAVDFSSMAFMDTSLLLGHTPTPSNDSFSDHTGSLMGSNTPPLQDSSAFLTPPLTNSGPNSEVSTPHMMPLSDADFMASLSSLHSQQFDMNGLGIIPEEKPMDYISPTALHHFSTNQLMMNTGFDQHQGPKTPDFSSFFTK